MAKLEPKEVPELLVEDYPKSMLVSVPELVTEELARMSPRQ